MDLIRDCLDKHLIDRDKRPMGRVDGIVLELESGRQPRVACIELGLATLADRVSSRLGKVVGNQTKRMQISTERYRIPWRKLSVGVNEVTADLNAETTEALAWELWLRMKIVGRIPGA